jgi:formate-dependent phosphoribosylglycinamide formyltransferase (GAR transformylase)
LKEAQEMAAKVTASLTGSGIWGVEFFLAPDGVYFSELSPRPHDTGMVTLAGTQNFSEFELHARAVLGFSNTRNNTRASRCECSYIGRQRRFKSNFFWFRKSDESYVE